MNHSIVLYLLVTTCGKQLAEFDVSGLAEIEEKLKYLKEQLSSSDCSCDIMGPDINKLETVTSFYQQDCRLVNVVCKKIYSTAFNKQIMYDIYLTYEN